jgi:hypothetical protein
MDRLKIGDKIICHVRDSWIVHPYAHHFTKIKLEIASVDSFGYFAYVPDYIGLNGATRVTRDNLESLEVGKKFLDCLVIYVQDSFIAEIDLILDGYVCKRCQEFCRQSEPNQEDGSFICYPCRFNKYR